MSNEAQSLIEGLLDKARDIARSETVVGQPITFNDVLVVPVVQISIGFGAGGGSGNDNGKNGGTGAGGGGGIRIEPSCFLVHDGTTVRLLPAKGGKGKGMDALIEKLPDLLTYAMDSLRGHGERPAEESSSDDDQE